jgi:hypothetical protein
MRITASGQRQTPLAAALSAFDERPEQVRTLLIDAEQADVAARVQNADLCNAARQIRSINVAAEPTLAPCQQRPPGLRLQVLTTLPGWYTVSRQESRQIYVRARTEEGLMASSGPIYVFDYETGSAQFYIIDDFVYSMDGQAVFWINDDYWYPYPSSGEPAFWVSGKFIYDNPPSSAPKYYLP